MWKLAREALGTLADILAILFAVPTLIAAVVWVWGLNNPWLKILLAVVAVGAIFIVVRLMRRLGGDSAKKFRGLKIEKDVRQLESSAKAHPHDFNKILPSASLLKNMKSLLDAEASTWADDARCISLNYYIDVNADTYGYSMQGFYYSKWKDVTYPLYFRDGALAPGEMTEGQYLSLDEAGIFFEFKGWREAFVKIHNKLKDKLGGVYHIQYTTISAEEARITYKFKEGKVERSQRFKFTDGIISEIK